MMMEDPVHSDEIEVCGDLQERAAYNLAFGSTNENVALQLRGLGLSQDAAAAMLESIRRSPIFRAATMIAREKKKLSDLNDLLLQLDQQSHSRAQVPIETGITPASFFEAYYTANRPVVLKGIASKWPACGKWDLDFFRREFGDVIIKYQCRDLSVDHVRAFFENSQSSTFASYISLIESDRPEARNVYLMSQDELLRRIRFRSLLKDIDCSIGGLFDDSRKSSGTYFWMGPQGAVTPLHRDQNNIYLAQIAGRKKVKLMPSLSVDRVYNLWGHHSEMDLDAIDFDRFERAKGLNIMEVIVHPGDILFIPVAWWHHVTSLDTTISISGSNFKYDNDFPQLADYFR